MTTGGVVKAWDGPSSSKQEAALRGLAAAAASRTAARAVMTKSEARVLVSIRRNINVGVPTWAIAAALDVTPGRVSQMVKRDHPAEPAEPVVAAVPAPARKLPTLEDGAPLVSGAASVRSVTHFAVRVTAWVDLVARRGVTSSGAVFTFPEAPARLRGMLQGLPAEVARVYLTGGRDTLGLSTELVRELFTSTAGEGWSVAPAGLYLADPDLPIGRWVSEAGRTVEVHRAATWLGEGNYGPELARDAMACLAELLRPRFGTGQWLSTPSTTGRDLWRRIIPEVRSYPVLSTELRELIHATSGQGRIELLPPAVETLPGFCYLDGRFMYAGLLWGMPVVTEQQPPRRWTGDEVARLEQGALDRLLKGRGRWLVRYRVPADWRHVGLLPVLGTSRAAGWTYPSSQGSRGRTWVDGAELVLALAHGWPVDILEGVTFAEGKPLNLWRDKLVDAWTAAATMPEPLAGLVRTALRAVVLHSVGAFASRTHLVTRHGTALEAQEADRTGRAVGPVTAVGQAFMWTEQPAETAWAQTMSHPEWSATVWARARVRLLDGPGADGTRVGALHLPRASVVAFRTDALYTDRDPRWSDDGAVGRFRVKGSLSGPVPAPTTPTELFQLRDASERTA